LGGGSARRKAAAYTEQTQTTMPQVAFKFTTPVVEWVKTVHALDRAATVIGWRQDYPQK
jgi:hypothetical protein